MEAHNVSHLPFRSWCSACGRGRGLSLGHRRVDAKIKEAEQIPTISVDCSFFGQPEDRAHNTLPVLFVCDRKSKVIWSHPMQSRGVVHRYQQGLVWPTLTSWVTLESSSSRKVERAVQSVQGFASPLRARVDGALFQFFLLFHKGEPHDGHTAYIRLKGKPWRDAEFW